jgi:hypothetical protein
MKHIPYVGDIHFESQAGKKLYCRVGSDAGAGVLASATLVLANGDVLQLEPVLVQQVEFFFERVSDPAYVETEPKLKAFEAGGRQHALRHALRVQAEAAKARGYWEIADEDDYTRLRNAVMNPKVALSLDRIEWNYHPFAQAVIDASTPPEESKSANGAAASAS